MKRLLALAHASRGAMMKVRGRLMQASEIGQIEPPRVSWRLFGLSQATTVET